MAALMLCGVVERINRKLVKQTVTTRSVLGALTGSNHSILNLVLK
jgi:hypothetical protein